MEAVASLIPVLGEISEARAKLSGLQLVEYQSRMRRAYLNELWLSELPPPAGSEINTQSLVARVEKGDREGFEQELLQTRGTHDTNPEEWWAIMHNLWVATTELLFSPDADSCALDEGLLKRTHGLITSGVLSCDQSGVYRTTSVSALGSSVVYHSPVVIGPAVSTLLKFVREREAAVHRIEDGAERLFQALCLGGLFFSQLLLIHPFRDGNGRLARVLLAFLLRRHTAAPVSLYLEGDRKKYIKMLEARGNGARAPVSVVNYISGCCQETAAAAVRSLALPGHQ